MQHADFHVRTDLKTNFTFQVDTTCKLVGDCWWQELEKVGELRVKDSSHVKSVAPAGLKRVENILWQLVCTS